VGQVHLSLTPIATTLVSDGSDHHLADVHEVAAATKQKWEEQAEATYHRVCAEGQEEQEDGDEYQDSPPPEGDQPRECSADAPGDITTGSGSIDTGESQAQPMDVDEKEEKKEDKPDRFSLLLPRKRDVSLCGDAAPGPTTSRRRRRRRRNRRRSPRRRRMPWWRRRRNPRGRRRRRRRRRIRLSWCVLRPRTCRYCALPSLPLADHLPRPLASSPTLIPLSAPAPAFPHPELFLNKKTCEK